MSPMGRHGMSMRRRLLERMIPNEALCLHVHGMPERVTHEEGVGNGTPLGNVTRTCATWDTIGHARRATRPCPWLCDEPLRAPRHKTLLPLRCRVHGRGLITERGQASQQGLPRGFAGACGGTAAALCRYFRTTAATAAAAAPFGGLGRCGLPLLLALVLAVVLGVVLLAEELCILLALVLRLCMGT